MLFCIVSMLVLIFRLRLGLALKNAGCPAGLVGIALVTLIPRRDFMDRAIRVLITDKVETAFRLKARLAGVQLDDSIQQAGERHDLGRPASLLGHGQGRSLSKVFLAP